MVEIRSRNVAGKRGVGEEGVDCSKCGTVRYALEFRGATELDTASSNNAGGM